MSSRKMLRKKASAAARTPRNLAWPPASLAKTDLPRNPTAVKAVCQNGDQPPREPEFGEGIIEISGKGFGFLRDAKRNFVQTPQDIFVTPEIVRRFRLRDGMWIYGETRRGNRGPQLTRLLKINDDEPTKYQGLRPFEELTTINPNERIKLETRAGSLHDADHGFDDARSAWASAV